MTSISFLCVGAQKCGTTALHSHLARHPGVFLPAVKESHFFCNGHGEYAQGLAHYLDKYFGEAPVGSLLGEIDPEYMYFPEAVARIARHLPSVKLIFLFREPVARAYSHYWMTVRRGREPLGFADALEAEPERLRSGTQLERSDFSYFARGLYFDQVSRFLEHFPMERMLFLLSDDLKRQPEATLSQVYGFLGVPAVPFEPLSDEEAHQAYMPRSVGFQAMLEPRSRIKKVGKAVLPAVMRRPLMQMMWRLQQRNRKPFEAPPLDPGLRDILRERYAADRARLEQLLGRSIAAWGALGTSPRADRPMTKQGTQAS